MINQPVVRPIGVSEYKENTGEPSPVSLMFFFISKFTLVNIML